MKHDTKTQAQIEADDKKGRELYKKAQTMRENAYINRGYSATERTKIARLMIGRADALESKAIGLMNLNNQ